MTKPKVKPPHLTVIQRQAHDRRYDPPVVRLYPELRVSAPHLEEAGFDVGAQVSIVSEPGRIVLTAAAKVAPKPARPARKPRGPKA